MTRAFRLFERVGTSDEHISLDRFWKTLEPFQSDLGTEHFHKLVMGLLFLKNSYEIFRSENEKIERAASADRRKAQRAFMKNRGQAAIREFVWLPPEARWPTIKAKIEDGQSGKVIDKAMRLIEAQNLLFEGSKAPSYCTPKFEQTNLRKLVATIDRIPPGSKEWAVSLYLGGVYAYWLTLFAEKRKAHRGDTINGSQLFTKPVEYSSQDEFYPMGPIDYPIPNVNPFFLTPTPTGVYRQHLEGVSFDGTNYLIVYCETYVSGGPAHLKGCRVTPQGQILDPDGFMIQSHGWGHDARVACGKDSKTGQPVYLVVWADGFTWTSTSVIRGALIRPGNAEIVVDERTVDHDFLLTGQEAIDSHGIMIFPDIKDYLNPYVEYPALEGYDKPDVCFNGADFVVTCLTSKERIIARLVDTSIGGVKVVTDPNKVLYPWGRPITLLVKKVGPTYSGVWHVRINSGGKQQCLVTWSRTVLTASGGLGELSGVKLDFTVGGESWKIGESKVICGTTEPPYSDCAVDSDGKGNYILAWHDLSQAAAKKTHPYDPPNLPDLARAAVQSIPSNPLEFNVNGYKITFSYQGSNLRKYYPRVAFDGQNYLIAWNGLTSDAINFDPRLGCLISVVIGAYVTPDSKLLGWFYVKANDGGGAEMPEVCFGKNEGLLAYTHTEPGGPPSPVNPLKINLIRLRFIGKTP